MNVEGKFRVGAALAASMFLNTCGDPLEKARVCAEGGAANFENKDTGNNIKQEVTFPCDKSTANDALPIFKARKPGVAAGLPMEEFIDQKTGKPATMVTVNRFRRE
ncbi:MAG TPA: hypothetical protein VI957_00200 [Candidatus Paceibacterota bacterium]